MSQQEQDSIPQQPSQPLMDEAEFASRIKRKHPEYAGMDDTDLTRRVLDKYPEYQSSVRLSAAPATASPSTASPFSGWLNPQTQPQPMDEHEFARRIKSKHPEYESLDDGELSRRVLNKYEEYRPLVSLSASAQRPSVTSTARDDVDFDAPLPPAVEDFKPQEFTPFHNSDMNIPARLAAGAAELGGADNPAARSPATDPDLYGKPVTLSIKSAQQSDDEMADAFFAAVSPAALKVNQRYRAETGRNLALPAVDRHNLEQYQDSQGSYQIPIKPTQELYRVINAYGHGGMTELESEMARMQTERQRISESERARQRSLETAKERAAQALGVKPEQFEVDPLRQGVADTMIGVSRLMNNVKGVFSSNPGEVARDAQFIQNSARSIPQPQTTAGKILRGVTNAATSLPLYMNPAAPVVAYTQNLDRGQEAAIESALPLVVAGGVGRGVGKVMEEAAPAVRQVVSRGAAGLTNAGIAVASGERDPGRLAASFGVGAAMPIGEGGSEPEFASTRPLAEVPATPSMIEPLHPSNGQPRNDAGQFTEGTPVETFTHPVLGKLTATQDQTGIGPEMVRVTNEESPAPFVVRRPNSAGIGGVRNVDSNNTNAAPVERTPSTTEKISNVLNVPRAIQTSLDTHSLFRQAALSFGSHPLQTLKTYFQSLPSLWSERYAGKMLNDIQSSPLAPVRQEAGLYLADYLPKSQPLSAREENLMTNLIGKIPGVRGTQRQFVTFLDKIRADAFDNYATANPDATPETLQGIARFINFSTGRGDLGAWGERHALGLSNIFYSPRFALSRVQLATTPFRGTTPEARAYAANELVRYVSTNVGLMLLAKAGGLPVGINPLSNDFGTVKVGNTRISLWGGMDKTARYVAQLMTGESASAQTGETRDRSRLDTAQTFIRTKLAPQTSVLVDLATGKDFKGQAVIAGSEARHLLTPISWNEIADAVKEDQRQGGSGWKGAAALPSLVGAQAQTFEEGPGVAPNLTDERRRLRLPENKSQPVENALSAVVTAPSYQALPGDDVRSRLLRTVQTRAAEDEAAGLSSDAVQLNARVNAQVAALRSIIVGEKSLTSEQRQQLMSEVNARFFFARVRSGDRRALSSVERVFGQQSRDSLNDLRKRIAALRK
jgi:hypothetical protein